jgi:hypothetical protein
MFCRDKEFQVTENFGIDVQIGVGPCALITNQTHARIEGSIFHVLTIQASIRIHFFLFSFHFRRKTIYR